MNRKVILFLLAIVPALAILLALLPSMIYRIWIEEKLLAEYSGNQFYKYADKTNRLIPGIW